MHSCTHRHTHTHARAHSHSHAFAVLCFFWHLRRFRNANTLVFLHTTLPNYCTFLVSFFDVSKSSASRLAGRFKTELQPVWAWWRREESVRVSKSSVARPALCLNCPKKKTRPLASLISQMKDCNTATRKLFRIGSMCGAVPQPSVVTVTVSTLP